MNNKAKIIKFTETIVKIIIVLLGLWILYDKIINNHNIRHIWQEIYCTFKDKKQIFEISRNMKKEIISKLRKV